MAETAPPAPAIYVDGQPYTIDDLTFREQRQMREFVKQLAPAEDVARSIEDASDADYIPAVIAVIKQRTDEDFTLEQALDFKPTDLEGPPTKPAAKKRAPKKT